MSKFVGVLLVSLSLSAILSWATIVFLWSDQQRLIGMVAKLEEAQLIDDDDYANQLMDQTLASIVGIDERVLELEQASISGAKKTEQVISTTNAYDNQSESNASANEYFIPMGSGQTTSTSWTDLEGTAVYISPTNYGAVREVLFEGGLSIVGGEVHARLKNKTTGAVIDVSEIKNNTQQSMTQVSNPFQLHAGNNQYIIQLRSSSGELAKIEGGRIRIVIQ